MRARTSVPLHRRRCHFLVPASASLATTLSASFVSTSRLALAPSLFANASQSWPKPEQAAGKADVSEAVRLIDAAKSIIIMCGAGCRGAAEELCALSDRLKAPLIHTVKGKDIMAYDDPAWVGDRHKARLQRGDALRAPAHARHRLPLLRVPAAEGNHHPGR